MGQKEIGRRKMSRVDCTALFSYIFSAPERTTRGYFFPVSITSLHAREFQIFLDETLRPAVHSVRKKNGRSRLVIRLFLYCQKNLMIMGSVTVS